MSNTFILLYVYKQMLFFLLSIRMYSKENRNKMGI